MRLADTAAWEQPAVDRIQIDRKAELRALWRIEVVEACLGAIAPITPILGAVVTIAAYSYTHGRRSIDTDRLFTAILLCASKSSSSLTVSVNTAYNPLVIAMGALARNDAPDDS